MQINVINLDRSADRYREFCSANGHLDFARFPAVDGSTVDLAKLVEQGLFSANIRDTYSAGGIGLAVSHLRLWDQAVATGKLVTACEDDAIFNLRFDAFTSENKWFLEGDNRVYVSGQPVYGLGTDTPESAAVDAKYTFVRVHDTAYRRVNGPFYVGAGSRHNANNNGPMASNTGSGWALVEGGCMTADDPELADIRADEKKMGLK